MNSTNDPQKADLAYCLATLFKITDAILRRDTEQDGAWGFPDFKKEIKEIRDSLSKNIQ